MAPARDTCILNSCKSYKSYKSYTSHTSYNSRPLHLLVTSILLKSQEFSLDSPDSP